MHANSCVDNAEHALRAMLESCSAMRRDRVLTTPLLNTESTEKALARMIERGEVEVIRPLYNQARNFCHYRLRRSTDGRHEAKPRQRSNRTAGRFSSPFALEFI